jgi:hypothetical protein
MVDGRSYGLTPFLKILGGSGHGEQGRRRLGTIRVSEAACKTFFVISNCQRYGSASDRDHGDHTDPNFSHGHKLYLSVFARTGGEFPSNDRGQAQTPDPEKGMKP